MASVENEGPNQESSFFWSIFDVVTSPVTDYIVKPINAYVVDPIFQGIGIAFASVKEKGNEYVATPISNAVQTLDPAINLGACLLGAGGALLLIQGIIDYHSTETGTPEEIEKAEGQAKKSMKIGAYSLLLSSLKIAPYVYAMFPTQKVETP